MTTLTPTVLTVRCIFTLANHDVFNTNDYKIVSMRSSYSMLSLCKPKYLENLMKIITLGYGNNGRRNIGFILMIANRSGMFTLSLCVKSSIMSIS